jgi:hypothetical protein
VKGFYELVLIQKKSMKLLDYKKRAEKFDQDSENLSVEKVEEKVIFPTAFKFRAVAYMVFL